MQAIKLMSIIGVGVLASGVLGGVLTKTFTKKPSAKELAKELTPSEKFCAVADDEVLSKRAADNFDLQSLVADLGIYVPFSISFNNGTGYYNALLEHEFVGKRKGQLLYTLCPSTSRMVIIIYKGAENGSNVVVFKRYSEVHSDMWMFQRNVGEWGGVSMNGEIDASAVRALLQGQFVGQTSSEGAE